jgi:hypothetical protein
MEKKIGNKLNEFLNVFKNDMEYMINTTDNKHELIRYLNNYKNIELLPEDFKRRKRIKNIIPDYNRCIAKKGDHSRCTRKKKENIDFCGTHEKAVPYGTIDVNMNNKQTVNNVDIWYHEINGIYYYIDKENNVYLPEDIISNKTNPRIIAQWKLDGSEYIINEI